MPRTAISIFLIIPLTVAVVQSLLGQAATADEIAAVPAAEFVYTATTSPVLSARAYYSLDIETGQALATHAADTPLPIASITKLITSAVFQRSIEEYEAGSIVVTPSDVEGMGRAGAIAPGEEYPLSVLPFPALVTSANTASVLMARSGNGTLVETANTYARENGFTHTSLEDAHGLSAANVSTAAELAAWFVHISDVTPTVRDITRLKQYMYETKGWRNNSPFISDPRYRGGKHGYTEAAGRTAVAAFSEAVPGGPDREVVYVLLGSADLVADMAALRAHIHATTQYR